MKRFISFSFSTLFLAAVAASAASGRTPQLILYLYLAVSLLTFAWYAKDKHAARKGTRRTPENRLHLLSLAGGWPGALIAQQQLRHKSRKLAFRIVFWGTVLLNCGALVFFHSQQGNSYYAP